MALFNLPTKKRYNFTYYGSIILKEWKGAL